MLVQITAISTDKTDKLYSCHIGFKDLNIRVLVLDILYRLEYDVFSLFGVNMLLVSLYCWWFLLL